MNARQTSLFDAEPDPVSNGTAGSKRAAKAIKPIRMTQRQRILQFIRTSSVSGRTREDIAWLGGIPIQSVCARCSELLGNPVIDGKLSRPVLIKAAPFTRANASGIQVEVLVLV